MGAVMTFQDPLRTDRIRFWQDWSNLSLILYSMLIPLFIWIIIDQDRAVQPGDWIQSLVILILGALAFFRSRDPWQRALALQVALILSPLSGKTVQVIFSSPRLDWIHGRPLPAHILAVIYLSLALPWLGLMFVPALSGLLRQRAARR
jgi:hypothetical protein